MFNEMWLKIWFIKKQTYNSDSYSLKIIGKYKNEFQFFYIIIDNMASMPVGFFYLYNKRAKTHVNHWIKFIKYVFKFY